MSAFLEKGVLLEMVTENVSTQLNPGFEQLPWAAAQRMSDRQYS